MMNLGKTKQGKAGITLIALVITIIVLLILAGVAINMAVNSDGLFGKAGEAADKWNAAANDERTTLLDYLDIMEETTGGIADIRPEIDGLPAKKTAAELAEYIPIYTTEQLRKVATGESVTIEGTAYIMAPGAKYALMNDLDFSTVTGMKPIKGFTGTFEGNGCTITNLNIDVTADEKKYTNVIGMDEQYYPAALFETVVNGTIKNLAVTNATIKAKESVAAIVAQGDNVTIDNCYVKDSNLTREPDDIAAHLCASGGIIGFIGNNGANISKCKVISTEISEKSFNGGICGATYGNIKISDCQVLGNEDKSITYTGGIMQYSKKNVDISNCKIQNISFLQAGILSVAETNTSTINISNCSAKNTISIGQYGSSSAIIYNSKGENTNIENCKVEGLNLKASGSGVIAGIVEGTNLKIDKCSVKDVTIDAGSTFAGILGVTNKAGTKSITNCSVDNITGDAELSYALGGIAHAMSGDFNIENCSVSDLKLKGKNLLAGGILNVTNGQAPGTKGTIKKCNVENFDVSISTTNANFGGIIGASGSSQQNLEISECNVSKVSIVADDIQGFYGGIAGFVSTGSINNCNATNISFNNEGTGTNNLAKLSGVLGAAGSVTISNCNATNIVIESAKADMFGGIAGFISTGLVENCNLANSTINVLASSNHKGGILGATTEASINKCKVVDTKITSGGGNPMGGICGFGANVSNCVVENTELIVTGGIQAVAGILGHGQKNTTVESLVQNCKVNNCTIDVNSGAYVGGIAGAAVANISNCTVNETTLKGNTTYLGGIQGFGGALGSATGSSGSTTSVTIENCKVTNCEILGGTYKNYIQGQNSYDQTNTSKDTITNSTYEGTTLGTL